MIWLLAMLVASPDPAIVQGGEQLLILGRDGGELDACDSIGRVTNLDPAGDNFLAVRSAPSTKAPTKDQVRTGQVLSLCDEDGEWFGVVYRLESDGDIECGVGTPSAYVGAYRGPCRFGWVHSRYVDLTAG